MSHSIWKKISNYMVIVFSLGSLLVSFQNCSKTKFTSPTDAIVGGSDFCTKNPSDPACVVTPINNDCTFNGNKVVDGQSVTAFQNSTVLFGQSCISETRKCTKGNLSGSYAYASCSVGAAAACLFNGVTIPHGQSVPAYQNSTVAYGATCTQENRTCNNGSLSGSYAYASCTVGAAAACLFNGLTVAHGQTVNAFQSSSVPYGGICASEVRKCVNGSLSGTYMNSSCTVGAASSCTFDGKTIAHGQNVVAYQNSNVAYGSTCTQETRTCTNGILSGSYNYGSCTVGAASSCTFDGKTIAHGQNVVAYQNSNVPYGSTCTQQTRTCNNGTLSGSYNFGSCSVGTPASCLFDGKTIPHSQFITAYQNSSVPFGSSCVSESRTCVNGSLSGSYNFGSCSVGGAASCLFDGKTIVHGQSVTAYQTSSVAFGGVCSSQTRTCNNGSLTGSFGFGSCTVGAASSCTFDGKTIAHGQSVTAYQTSSVAFGGSCTSETRVCSNGTMSGSYGYGSCAVGAPAACVFNGSTVAHGQSVTAYQNSSVPYGSSCSSESRTCSNGSLSGSYSQSTCSVESPKSCWMNGVEFANGTQITTYTTSTVPYNQSCISYSSMRQCLNGSWSGNPSATQFSCVTQAPRSCSYTVPVIATYDFDTGAPIYSYETHTMNHGETKLFYDKPRDFRCSTFSQRTCTDGSLSGNSSFVYDSCIADGSPGSPLMVEMNVSEADHKPLLFSSQIDGIIFDLLGLNAIPKPFVPVQISWYKEKNYYFLVLPDKNGEVKGINQLFGNNTFGPDKKFAKDGYHALAKYDGMTEDGLKRIANPDAMITANDPVFSKLRLWNDKNYDGRAQPEELSTLDDLGIVAIDLKFDKDFLETDRYGNETRMKSVVITRDNRMHLIFDVWFKYIAK